MIDTLAPADIDPALLLRYGRAKSVADLDRTTEALERNGFVVRRAANAAEAKEIVLSLIPEGAEVAEGASQTRQLTGVTEAIEASERYKPVRPRIWAMDRQTQADQIRRLAVAPRPAGVWRAQRSQQGPDRQPRDQPRPHHRGPGRRGHWVLRQALPLKEE